MTIRATSVLVGLLLAGTVGYVAIGDNSKPSAEQYLYGGFKARMDSCLEFARIVPNAQAGCDHLQPICHGDTNIGRIICDDGKSYPLVQDDSVATMTDGLTPAIGDDLDRPLIPECSPEGCSAIHWVPDPRIASTDRAEICGFVDGLSYSRRHRALLTEEDRRADFERSGVPWSEHRYYELDHIVPLCLGGADVPANRHAQRWLDARVKDNLEKHACKEVCAGRLPPETAQGWFLGDWKAAYRQQFGVDP